MDIALWVAAIMLAGAFLVAGLTKALRSREQLQQDPRMTWTEDFSPGFIRAIGVAEVLGAVALVVPPLVGVAEALTPVAATALAVTMVGAALTHGRRRETQAVLPPLVLLAACAFVAWGRFGPHAF